MRTNPMVSLALSCMLGGCAAQYSPPPPPKLPSAEEALAVQSRVVDCEWKAANRYDDSRYSVADLARRIIGLCAVELTQARLAFRGYGLSPNDPQFDLDEFKQAVDIVEKVRKSKR
jgi:hypothetical protein